MMSSSATVIYYTYEIARKFNLANIKLSYQHVHITEKEEILFITTNYLICQFKPLNKVSAQFTYDT
jgi:hypothetical protein